LTRSGARHYSVTTWGEVGGDGPVGLVMFRGATKVTLDAKGRMAIPSRYRERLLTVAAGRLVATVDRDYCLLLYPLPDWEEIERKLVRLPTLNKQVRRLQRLMVGYATELEMDGHGRVLLPRELREFAGLERQAMLIGQGNKFELWNDERWSKRRDEWLADDEGEEAGLPQELESLSL
jgi:MraZ protein